MTETLTLVFTLKSNFGRKVALRKLAQDDFAVVSDLLPFEV